MKVSNNLVEALLNETPYTKESVAKAAEIVHDKSGAKLGELERAVSELMKSIQAVKHYHQHGAMHSNQDFDLTQGLGASMNAVYIGKP